MSRSRDGHDRRGCQKPSTNKNKKPTTNTTTNTSNNPKANTNTTTNCKKKGIKNNNRN